jgi:predicted DsbA family dithiol-disulfide isomerase
MRIDVWSDVICPWCYLGEHRLQLAIDQLAWGEDIAVRWRAYQLDPRAPVEPQDLERVVDRKYGPGAHAAMTTRLTQLGAAEGLEYRFDRAQRVNTLDAQRMLLWAGDVQPTAQMPLARALFKAYFTDGRNVADHDVLSRVMVEVGLDDEAGLRTLASASAYLDAVESDREAALERGMTGVPAFVIEGKWLIPGAQEVETMVSVLDRARAKLVG